MKDKKKVIGIVFGIVCAVILAVCAVIYFYIKNEDAIKTFLYKSIVQKYITHIEVRTTCRILEIGRAHV